MRVLPFVLDFLMLQSMGIRLCFEFDGKIPEEVSVSSVWNVKCMMVLNITLYFM
jgi:hypothetical protein